MTERAEEVEQRSAQEASHTPLPHSHSVCYQQHLSTRKIIIMSDSSSSTYKALVLGDSFVYGYGHYLHNRGIKTPMEVAEHLKVSEVFDEVHILGYRRAKITAYSLPLEELEKVRPEIAVVDCSTNDIKEGGVPLVTSAAVATLADTLVREHGVKVVAMMGVIPRNTTAPDAGSDGVEPAQFEVSMRDHNSKLQDVPTTLYASV